MTGQQSETAYHKTFPRLRLICFLLLLLPGFQVKAQQQIDSLGRILAHKYVGYHPLSQDPDEVFLSDMVQDESGNYYVSGTWGKSLVIGTPPGVDTVIPPTGPVDFRDHGFILKLDSNLNFLWFRSLSGDTNSWSNINSLGILNDGNLMIQGDFIGNVTFFDGVSRQAISTDSSTLKSNAFHIEMDGWGNQNTFLSVRSKDFTQIAKVHEKTNGSKIFILDDFQFPIVLGDDTIEDQANGRPYLLVLELDSRDNLAQFEWLEVFDSGPEYFFFNTSNLDHAENLLISYSIRPFVDSNAIFTIGNDTVAGQGTFISKLDPQFDGIWSTGFGMNNYTQITSLISDNNGNIFQVGTSYSARIPSKGFLSRLTSNGDLGWVYETGGNTCIPQNLRIYGDWIVWGGDYEYQVQFDSIIWTIDELPIFFEPGTSGFIAISSIEDGSLKSVMSDAKFQEVKRVKKVVFEDDGKFTTLFNIRSTNATFDTVSYNGTPLSSNVITQFSGNFLEQSSATQGEEIDSNEELVVWPNPSNSTINFAIPQKDEAVPSELLIHNSLGKRIASRKISPGEIVSLDFVQPGVYFATLRNFESEDQVAKKFIIEK